MIEKTAQHAQNEYTMAAPSNTVNGAYGSRKQRCRKTLIRHVEDVNCITILQHQSGTGYIFNVIQ